VGAVVFGTSALVTSGALLISGAAFLVHEQNAWLFSRSAFLHHVIGWTCIVAAFFPLAQALHEEDRKSPGPADEVIVEDGWRQCTVGDKLIEYPVGILGGHRFRSQDVDEETPWFRDPARNLIRLRSAAERTSGAGGHQGRQEITGETSAGQQARNFHSC